LVSAADKKIKVFGGLVAIRHAGENYRKLTNPKLFKRLLGGENIMKIEVIRDALKALGYHVQIYNCDYDEFTPGRAHVYWQDNYMGIFDFNKNTFVD